MPSAFGISQSFWQNGVLDRDVVDPSLLTPANGDRFIVGPSAIGVWAGQDNNIAEFNATFSVWSFSSPVEGWTTYIVDEDIYVRYTGIAWVILGSAAINFSVEEDSINIASDVDTINLTGGVAVSDDGNGKVTIDIIGDAIAVEDGGVNVITDLVTLNFGSNLIVTDDGSGKVTVDGSGSQNLWETITADSGLTTANTTTDTLNVVGGSNVTTVIAGDTLTISAAGGGFDQNLWETITSDSGSTTANTITDTLTIAGGTNVTTAISGDTLTISTTGTSDQNLWETITADSGSTTANTTTDTLNILGTSSEIVTSVVSDTMFIGIDDNAILPGTESVTLPTGTTAQRPVTPTAGM